MDERCKQYHSALSRCAELLDNMKDGDPITEVPDFLASYLASQSQAAQSSDEKLRETDGYKLGWMEGMQEGAELATGGEKTAADVEAEFADLLPGSYYMDPPDGGSPSVLEQVSRMAEDAAQWRAHLAGQSQATRAVPDLHNAIMNLPCKRTLSHFPFKNELLAYKEGHRDARHAAAELVNEFEAAQEVIQQAVPTEAPIHPAIAKLKAECAEATRALKPYESPPEAPALQQAAKADPIGVVGTMPGTDGFTMACFKASEVPVGTELYLAPTTSTVSAPEEVRNQVDVEEVIDALRYSLEQAGTIAQDGLKPKQSSSDLRMQFKRIINVARAGLSESALRTTSGKGEAA